MPRPKTLAMTSGLSSSAASPANATAHAVPAGVAPLQAMWNGMLARVGSSAPGGGDDQQAGHRLQYAQFMRLR